MVDPIPFLVALSGVLLLNLALEAIQAKLDGFRGNIRSTGGRAGHSASALECPPVPSNRTRPPIFSEATRAA
jgi:hypothetical protein